MKFSIIALFFLASFGGSSALAQNGSPSSTQENSNEEIDPLFYVLPKDKNEIIELGWDDLLPPGEAERMAMQIQTQMQSLFNVAEGSAGDVATQFGTHNTVDILQGHKIRIPGYTVPFEFAKNAKIKEFLLVPYYGACLHAPPPPPNQTIYVTTDKPIKLKDLQQAVWVEGYVEISSVYTDLAESAYTIRLTNIEIYDE